MNMEIEAEEEGEEEEEEEEEKKKGKKKKWIESRKNSWMSRFSFNLHRA